MLIKRFEKNPILVPNRGQSWEGVATFNGCPIRKGNKIFLFYRALSFPQWHPVLKQEFMFSTIGLAESKDGINFFNRRKFIFPEHPWEQFGCEDPRVTKFNKKYYIFYTALSHYPFQAEGIKIGLAISKDLKKIEEKHLITPFNAKAMALFPEKIKGKMWALLTVHTDKPPAHLCLANFKKEEDLWSEKYWQQWYNGFEKKSLILKREEKDHLELGSPPLKTKYGWLIFYSYIQNYFSGQPLFTIEAALLDLKNPAKIVAKTNMPLLTPERYYEKMGFVQNIVFPSGALLEKKQIYLYYGAADMTCCLALISFSDFVSQLRQEEKEKIKFERGKLNPIIVPNKENAWEAKATYNPGAIKLGGKIHLLYRAQSQDNTSVLGYATTKDGIHIDFRSKEPVYVPREEFEQKEIEGAGSGCEDPRLTQIGNKIYMFYTAFNGKDRPRVALTWILVKDFLNQKWNWAKPKLISPPEIDNKNTCLFPEKVQGKYLIIHRTGKDIDFTLRNNLDFKEGEWLEENRWIYARQGMWDSRKVGAVAPPIKTRQGWILFYHGVSERDGAYRVGAILLDLKNPLKLLARTKEPILEPETEYEKEGQVPNVVFPCGAVALGKNIFLYYGGADKVVGVATIKIDKLLKKLKSSRI